MDENLDEWHAAGHTGDMNQLLAEDKAISIGNLMALYQGSPPYFHVNIRPIYVPSSEPSSG